ncbi:MAG TPA: hypothetical protein VMH83_03225, partial [Candidatus Acidoferrum sp.]|nr:hypothetical protein [Candidatus Acidoferrum sp.]
MQFGRYHWLAFGLALAVLLFDLRIPLGVACGILYTGVVLVAQFTRNSRFIYLTAVISSVLTVIGYWGSPEGGAVHWMVLTNRGLSIYVIWLTAWLTVKVNQQHLAEMQSLTRLLPICAWCKQIRD